MTISYDPEADAMYITLVDGVHQCRNVCLNDEITLDFAADETLVGIEILDAKRVVGQGAIPQVIVDYLPMAAA